MNCAGRTDLVFGQVVAGDERLVDLQHDPVEQRAVQTLRHGVARSFRLQKEATIKTRLLMTDAMFERSRCARLRGRAAC